MRISLRKKIADMKIGDYLKVPKDYEEGTVRNFASRVGASMGRKYSVSKDSDTRQFTVIRNS